MNRTGILRFAALLLAAFAGGAAATGLLLAAPAAATIYDKLDIFSRVLADIENSYVEPVDERKLVYNAIRGMLKGLDPHSAFMDPKEYQQMRADTTGEFGGLGLDVTMREGALVVISPIDDTPAARAGIEPGDEILSIDGAATREMSISDAIAKMQGPPGTRVELLLMRKGFVQPRKIPIVREHIRVNPVDGRLVEGAFGYVRIRSFQDRTDVFLKSLTREASQAGRRFPERAGARSAQQPGRSSGASGPRVGPFPRQGAHRFHGRAQPRQRSEGVCPPARQRAQLPDDRPGQWWLRLGLGDRRGCLAGFRPRGADGDADVR